jgi:hypothetical protein
MRCIPNEKNPEEKSHDRVSFWGGGATELKVDMIEHDKFCGGSVPMHRDLLF